MQINYLATVIMIVYRMRLRKKYTYYEHITALLAALQCELMLKSSRGEGEGLSYVGPHKMWRSEGLDSIYIYIAVYYVCAVCAAAHGSMDQPAIISVLKRGEDVHQKWARNVWDIGGMHEKTFIIFEAADQQVQHHTWRCTDHWSLYGRHFPHFNIKIKLLELCFNNQIII